MRIESLILLIKVIISSLIITTLVTSSAYAFKFTEKVCREYGLGSNWHCVPDDMEESQNHESKSNSLTLKDILNADIPADQKAIELNALHEKQLKTAVITEEKKDIQNFLETHNFIAAKGIGFAKNVQQVIDNSPRYSNNESYYKNVVEQQIREDDERELLKESSNRYALVFVYSARCSHCARQLPILKAFREEYHYKILGITAESERFEGLDENHVNAEIVNDPLIQSYPTILLLDKQIPGKVFISKGLITSDQLESKIIKRIIEREGAQYAGQ